MALPPTEETPPFFMNPADFPFEALKAVGAQLAEAGTSVPSYIPPGLGLFAASGMLYEDLSPGGHRRPNIRWPRQALRCRNRNYIITLKLLQLEGKVPLGLAIAMAWFLWLQFLFPLTMNGRTSKHDPTVQVSRRTGHSSGRLPTGRTWAVN